MHFHLHDTHRHTDTETHTCPTQKAASVTALKPDSRYSTMSSCLGVHICGSTHLQIGLHARQEHHMDYIYEMHVIHTSHKIEHHKQVYDSTNLDIIHMYERHSHIQTCTYILRITIYMRCMSLHLVYLRTRDACHSQMNDMHVFPFQIVVLFWRPYFWVIHVRM